MPNLVDIGKVILENVSIKSIPQLSLMTDIIWLENLMLRLAVGLGKLKKYMSNLDKQDPLPLKSEKYSLTKNSSDVMQTEVG